LKQVIFPDFFRWVSVADDFLNLIENYIGQDNLLSDLLEAFLLISGWLDYLLLLALFCLLWLLILLHLSRLVWRNVVIRYLVLFSQQASLKLEK
jgi:hypothetical protein